MNDEQHSSLLARILSVTFFSVLTLAALTWFFISITELISKFRLGDPVVGFDKGSMYMLGCGLGLLLLSIGGVMQGIIGLKLTRKVEELFTRGIVISLLLMFAFPQLAHYLVDKYAHKQHYSICSDVTYRWLLYGKFYYTENKIACDKLIDEKEITKSSSGR
jgi:hypothetical protein